MIPPAAAPQGAALTEGQQARAIGKTVRRIVPFLLVCYLFSYLDRVNVGLAALTMNDDIGLTPRAFGWGAGLFFLSYFAFEIPSNLLLYRVGARRWISRILVTWGLIAAATAFVAGPASFAAARFCLGAAEAGFVPGVFLSLASWFPARWRAQVTGLFLLGNPAANIIGAPLAGLLFQMGGLAGLHGWQWLLLIEGLPAAFLGIACLFVLPDGPRGAKWLTDAERAWLAGELAAEVSPRHVTSLGSGLKDRRVLVLAFINFCGIVGSVGVGLWLPQIIRSLGLSVLQTAIISALPYLFGAAAMLAAPRLVRSQQGRPFAVVASFGIAIAGLLLAAVLGHPAAVVAALCVTVIGTLSFQPNFWAIPPSFLKGEAAAGGLALIVAVGNIGGFVGPSLIGFVRDASGGFAWPLVAVAGVVLAGALAMAGFGARSRVAAAEAG